MRSIRWLAITAMLAALGGCQGTGTTGCFGMEPGDCGGFPATAPDVPRVFGFPSASVDPSSQGQMRVGDTVTLKLALFPGADTLYTSQTATWALASPTTVVRVTGDTHGAGYLEAIAPGTVDLIQVNGYAVPIWSCTGTACTQLSRIVVSP